MATGYHIFLLASCCSVDVVNGAEGVFLPGLVSISEISKSDILASSINLNTSSSFLNFLSSSASNGFFSSQIKVAIVLKADLLLNFCISLSLSTTTLTATDCTLQAESHHLTFLRKTGDNSKPTKRSKTLLACCASTKFISSVLGFFMASVIAVFVIS